jgi:hypothetical protein
LLELVIVTFKHLPVWLDFEGLFAVLFPVINTFNLLDFKPSLKVVGVAKQLKFAIKITAKKKNLINYVLYKNVIYEI